MDPITHLMTGACLARAGFNRKVAYATAVMTIAAETPDIDTLWGLGGPVAGFQHHRGITHTFLGLPVDAAAVVGAMWLFHRWNYKRKKVSSEGVATFAWKAPALPPVRWGLLYWFALIALLSHLLLDWTNNYGIRPFFPFNPRWYAGSIVFIVEPVLDAVLLVGLLAPALFGLINSEVGEQRVRFRGRGWAIAALMAIVAFWGWREVEKEEALSLALGSDFGANILRVGINPYPITPFVWHVVVETPDYYKLAMVNTWDGTVTTSAQDTFYRPATTISTLVAKRSWLGEAFLDWAQFPLVEEVANGNEPVNAKTLTTVTFRDLRYMYDVPFLAGRKEPVLEGSVTINEDRKVVEMKMDGKPQRLGE